MLKSEGKKHSGPSTTTDTFITDDSSIEKGEDVLKVKFESNCIYVFIYIFLVLYVTSYM